MLPPSVTVSSGDRAGQPNDDGGGIPSDWNPMLSDYVDPNKNAYKGLNLEQQPGFRARAALEATGQPLIDNTKDELLTGATAPTYRLYVTNVPIGLSMQGVQNLFGKFGTLIDVEMESRRSTNLVGGKMWVRVTFTSLAEAQAAMNGLDRKPPHNLRVQYALTHEELRRRKEKESAKMERGSLVNQRLDAFYRTKGINTKEIDIGELTGKGLMLKQAAMSRRIPRAPMGRGLLDPHNVSGFSSHDEEDAWIRLHGLVPPPQQQQPVQQPLKVDKSVYTFGQPLVLPSSISEHCLHCGQRGKVRCSRCKAWYCSQSCQHTDWQRHRPHCQPPPPLEKLDGTPFRQPSKTLRQPLGTSSEPPVNKDSRPEEVKKVDPEPNIKEAPVKVDPEAKKEAPVVKVDPEVKVMAPEKVDAEVKKLDPEVKKVDPEVKKVDIEVKTMDIEVKKVDPEVKKEGPAKVNPDKNLVKVEKKKVVTIHEPAKTNKCLESVLTNLMPGDVIEVHAMFDYDEENCAKKFPALVIDEDVVNFLVLQMDKFVNVNKKVEKKDVKPGQFVLSYLPEDENHNRALIVQVEDDGPLVMEIDGGKMQKIEWKNVDEMPEECWQHASLGIDAICQGEMSSSLSSMIQTNVATETCFFATVKAVNFNKKTKTLRNVEVTMMGPDKKPIINYTLTPWYADPQTSKVLKLPVETVTLEDLPTVNVEDGDEVLHLDFGLKCDQVKVHRLKDTASIGRLESLMSTEACKMRQLTPEDVHEDLLVSCQWSEDNQYYRALITAVNLSVNKVKVRFVDYGNSSVENIARTHQLPPEASEFPCLAKMLTLDHVPELATKDSEVVLKLKQLEPILASPMTAVKGPKDGFILVHPNGQPLNKMLQNKLQEAPAMVEQQGYEIGGNFAYDKMHIAELNKKEEEGQDVIVLNAESPTEIFVCPTNQIGLAENVTEQVQTYCEIDKEMVGFAPAKGKVCLAQSVEDDAWYRGACLQVNEDDEGEDTFTIFFVDFGFKEVLHRERLKMADPILMETVFLANHCVLEGFDKDPSKVEEYAKHFGPMLQELLPMMHETSLKVISHCPESGLYVVRIPEIEAKINIGLIQPKEKEGGLIQPKEKEAEKNIEKEGLDTSVDELRVRLDQEAKEKREMAAKLEAMEKMVAQLMANK